MFILDRRIVLQLSLSSLLGLVVFFIAVYICSSFKTPSVVAVEYEQSMGSEIACDKRAVTDGMEAGLRPLASRETDQDNAGFNSTSEQGKAFLQASRRASRTVRVVATGYTVGTESTGKRPGDPGYGITKSGLVAARGVCAVDPKIFPMGSLLYAPGYGYAVCLDTGDDIRGYRIDLLFPTVQEARVWGVREVDVEVIGVVDVSR